MNSDLDFHFANLPRNASAPVIEQQEPGKPQQKGQFERLFANDPSLHGSKSANASQTNLFGEFSMSQKE